MSPGDSGDSEVVEVAFRHASAVGMALLCALAICLSAAQGASAKGVTAVTCSAGSAVKIFSDGHCDKEVGASEGSFGQIPIEAGQEPEIQLSNAKTKNETKEATPTVLKATVAGVATEITCNAVSGTGKATNKEIAGVKQNEGTGLSVKFSSCTVNKPAKCAVKEPIAFSGTSITVETLGAGKNEMGIEFKPAAEKPFTEVTLENSGAETCALKGKTVSVQGSLVGTGARGSTEAVMSTGATLLFTNAMSKETLKVAGVAAEVSGSITVSLSDEAAKPLTLATIGPPEEVTPCGEWEWTIDDCELWGSEKGILELEEEFEPKVEWSEEKLKFVHDPVLFVHGFVSDYTIFQTMVHSFLTAGYPAGALYNWSYEWWNSNVTTASQIKTKVEQILAGTGRSKVDIITHSMGALPSRFYIKELGGASKVDDWVSLGGPNHGTTTANTCTGFARTMNPCTEMLPGSNFLRGINRPETPAGPHYGTWRSPCDSVIVPPISVEIGGTATNHLTACLSHAELTQDPTVIQEVREFVE